MNRVCCIGFQKCIDKESHATKGYFVYLVEKISGEYGLGNKIVAPRNHSSLWVTPEQFGKLGLKVGSYYECFSINGYVDWDSFKVVE